MTTQRFYEIVPLSSEDADALRQAGGKVYVADEMPGYPCRQCLRDAAIGDEMLLVSHDPFVTSSPYRSASPIFLHRAQCGSVDDGGSLPIQLTRRQLAVRSFDASGMMLDAAVIDGEVLDATIRRLLGEEQAERLHIHNAARGCYAATVTRIS